MEYVNFELDIPTPVLKILKSEAKRNKITLSHLISDILHLCMDREKKMICMDNYKGLEFLLYPPSSEDKKKTFYVAKQNEFEIEIEIPKKYPEKIQDLNCIDYTRRSRLMNLKEADAIVDWLSKRDKLIPHITNLESIKIQAQRLRKSFE